MTVADRASGAQLPPAAPPTFVFLGGGWGGGGTCLFVLGDDGFGTEKDLIKKYSEIYVNISMK